MSRDLRNSYCLVFCVAIVFSGNANATEAGLTDYPIGVNTVVPAGMPLPGKAILEFYNLFYTASKFTGSNGKSAIPGFNLNAYVVAPRLLYTWPVELGGFTLTSGFVQPIVYSNVSVPGAHDGRAGFADFTIQPLYLSYANSKHNLIVTAGFDVFIPEGTFRVGHVANPAFNTYSFDPNLSATWFATPRLEVSGSLYGEAHLKNEDTGYQSGTFIDLDYGINYQIAPKAIPKLSLGLNGFLFNQVTDDSLHGARYLDGFRGHEITFGPQLVYLRGKLGYVLKWQHDFWNENRPKGERVWFQVAINL